MIHEIKLHNVNKPNSVTATKVKEAKLVQIVNINNIITSIVHLSHKKHYNNCKCIANCLAIQDICYCSFPLVHV